MPQQAMRTGQNCAPTSGLAGSIHKCCKLQFLGEASVTGHEPLGLPASGKVNIWLPRPAQRTPRPASWHAGQAKRWKEDGQNGPPRAPPALKLSMLAK
eukprot:1136160-Pelagomonas_calceolata.AAC.5